MRLTLRLLVIGLLQSLCAMPGSALAQDKKPNILVIMGDDIGQTHLSAYSFGLMGYRTLNIDRIAGGGPSSTTLHLPE